MNNPILSAAERSFRDIAMAERQMRQQAEQAVQSYIRLLTAVANQLAGTALEKERRLNPNGPDTWLPDRWEAFLTQHVFMRAVSGWGEVGGGLASDDQTGGSAAEPKIQEETLSSAIARLRQHIRLISIELDTLDLEIKDNTAVFVPIPAERPASPLVPGEPLLDDLVRMRAKARTPTMLIVNPHQALSAGSPIQSPKDVHTLAFPSKESPELSLPSIQTDVADGEAKPRGHTGIVDELRRWQSPAIPMRFRQLAGISPDRWYKQSMALYLVARYGISARLEIDALLSQATDADRRTSALRKAVDLLPELGLLTRENLEVTVQEGVNSRFVVMDLTRQGRELCEILGWQIAESDRARAIRLFHGSAEQLLGIFFLAGQARLRGYQALVFPAPELASMPDLLLERGAESRYTFVEFGPQFSERWVSSSDLPGTPAYFTLTRQCRPQSLALLKNQEHEHPHLAHGALTDFETLIGVRKITPDAPLWTDIW